MSLEVLEPGPCTLLVDAGRPRHRSLGVPLGGAADRAALAQGNALVGNSLDTPAVEFALVGPTLLAKCDLGCVIFGAPFVAAIDDVPLRTNTCFTMRAGTVLRIGPTPVGVRGYLCVRGGFRAAETLGSQSALEPVKRKQVLQCDIGAVAPRSLAEPLLNYEAGEVAIRCLAGPQADWFDTSQFFGPAFTISPASNRMGLRLQGEALSRPARELVSEPVCPGTVQVVNDGQCIVLGVDGQTIGGYPKVAQVIAGDLDRLGQLRPGQYVRFETVSIDDAELAFAERQKRLNEIMTRLAATSN